MSDRIELGECYNMKGCKGKMVFIFNEMYKIAKIGIFHPLHGIKNAMVKDFKIIGVKDSKENVLGSFDYDKSANFQEFIIESNEKCKIVFNVQSNHGNKNYTCIYKIFYFC